MDDKSKPEVSHTVNDDALANESSKDKAKIFRYGNYNRYYGTRNKGLERDPRLNLFNENWFRNCAVLDVGCNVGHLTLTIARDFEPRQILGIDIDPNLIGIARKNIRHYCPDNEKLVGKLPASVVKANDESSSSNQYKFPSNVWFHVENYVFDSDHLLEMVKPEFDVIMALSITKWIHLNWGDDGIRRFFQRAFCQLRSGGRFILEPQEFSTYGRRARHKMNAEMMENYRNIKFKPEEFKDYLLSDKVGFVSVEELGAPQAKSKGFERPIFVFRKAIVREKYYKSVKSVKRKADVGADVSDYLHNNVINNGKRSAKLVRLDELLSDTAKQETNGLALENTKTVEKLSVEFAEKSDCTNFLQSSRTENIATSPIATERSGKDDVVKHQQLFHAEEITQNICSVSNH